MDTECLISPRREKGEAEISGTVVLCPNPADVLRFVTLSKRYSAKQLFLYNSKLLRVSGGRDDFYICGPAVGAPMAVLALEKLIVLGARKIIVFGTCGAISKRLAVGDLFLPVSAFSEEGTSQHYPLADEPCSSQQLSESLVSCLKKINIEPTSGKIWTTDAPYRETREKIARYGGLGGMAVDMEFSALISVAAFRRVELAAVMIVSDLLTGDRWQSGFSDKGFKGKCAQVCELIFECCLGGEL
nr:nucleoside phosphorylase [Desulfobulbaceae bacterium]